MAPIIKPIILKAVNQFSSVIPNIMICCSTILELSLSMFSLGNKVNKKQHIQKINIILIILSKCSLTYSNQFIRCCFILLI